MENEPSIEPWQTWGAVIAWSGEAEEEEEREEGGGGGGAGGGGHPRTAEDDEETDAESCLICRVFDCQCPPVLPMGRRRGKAFRWPRLVLEEARTELEAAREDVSVVYAKNRTGVAGWNEEEKEEDEGGEI